MSIVLYQIDLETSGPKTNLRAMWKFERLDGGTDVVPGPDVTPKPETSGGAPVEKETEKPAEKDGEGPREPPAEKDTKGPSGQERKEPPEGYGSVPPKRKVPSYARTESMS
jgi:hypothetical protein